MIILFLPTNRQDTVEATSEVNFDEISRPIDFVDLIESIPHSIVHISISLECFQA